MERRTGARRAEDTGTRELELSEDWGQAYGLCPPPPSLGSPVPDGGLAAPAPCPAELMCWPHRLLSAQAQLERPNRFVCPVPAPSPAGPPSPGALCSGGLGGCLLRGTPDKGGRWLPKGCMGQCLLGVSGTSPSVLLLEEKEAATGNQSLRLEEDTIPCSDASSSEAQLCDLGQVISPLWALASSLLSAPVSAPASRGFQQSTEHRAWHLATTAANICWASTDSFTWLLKRLTYNANNTHM